jgi:hypothetical protein
MPQYVGHIYASFRQGVWQVCSFCRPEVYVIPFPRKDIAHKVDFGAYPLLDILTVVPVQLVFADRSVKINNRSLVVSIVNYGFM